MFDFTTHTYTTATARRRLVGLLLAVVALLCLAPATALGQHPILRNYSPTEYGGGTQNWCVAQNYDGRMMFGNNHGLLYFDGRHWDIAAMPNYTAVRAVHYEASSHRTYVGASDEFGYFDAAPSTGLRTYHSLSQSLPKGDRLSGEIWNIFECGGHIVMQSKDCLYLIATGSKGADDVVTTIHMPSRIEIAAPWGERVVAAGREGVWALDPSGRLRTLATVTRALQGMTVRQIIHMDGRLIFATAQHGLWAWQPKADTVTPLTLDITPYLTANQIFCAAARHGQLAIGTVGGGLVVKDFTTGRTTYASTASGLRASTVLSVGYDNNGNLWMGLNNGIAQLPFFGGVGGGRPSAVALTSSIGGIGTGYASIRKDGVLYLGTNQGLYTLPYPLVASPTPAVPRLVAGMTGQVWALADAGGTLMACTDGGLYEIAAGLPHRVEGLEGTWNVIALPSAAAPRLLACDYNGFAVLQRRGAHYTLLHRVGGINLVSGNFVLDPDGSLWVAHWRTGVYHFTLDKEYAHVTKTEHFGSENGLATDEGSTLVTIAGRNYISAVGGLFAYDARRHTLHHAEALQSLFKVWDPALRLVDTPAGDIFAVGKNYLALARRQKASTDGTAGAAKSTAAAPAYKVDHISYSELVHGLQFGIGNIGFADDTHTILNTNDGFLLVDHNYRSSQRPNRLIVRSITSTGEGEQTLYSAMPQSESMHLSFPKHQNSLRIEFVLPEYASPGDIVYQCMLEGYDREWSDERSVNTKEYTKLPKGRYSFCIKARNVVTGDTQTARLPFEILPAWYETWIAYCLYGIMAVAAIIAAFRAYKRRAQRAIAKQMEQQMQLQREERIRLEAENARKEREVVELRNRQLELELKHRSSKLADSTTNLIRKNDILHDIDERLQELAGTLAGTEARPQAARRIAELRRAIHSNMMDDNNWDKFEQNFNLVYDNFMVRLSKRFPDLNASDKRICAYLRMGLSSKEMASLMNTAVRSIETARYRLRKKLKLEGGENLVDFIQSFESNAESPEAEGE